MNRTIKLSYKASLLGAVALSGVGFATGALAAGKTIAVAVADQKSLFYVAAVAGMKDEAAKQGVELRIVSADNNSGQQIKQVQDLLVQNPGALIFISQDSTAAAAGVKAANQANVPVIAVDEKPESGQGKLATYIATDSVKAARELCSWQFDQIGKKGNIAILHGVSGATAEAQRTQGCQEALKNYPDIKVVAEQTANWDETEAFKATQNILTANPDLKAVFGESDAMAIGAAKAAKKAGRNGLVFTGIDGFPTMFTAIRQGLVQGSKAQSPYGMGVLAVQNAVDIMNGKTVPEVQLRDATLITKDNVDKEDVTKYYGPTAKDMQ